MNKCTKCGAEERLYTNPENDEALCESCAIDVIYDNIYDKEELIYDHCREVLDDWGWAYSTDE